MSITRNGKTLYRVDVEETRSTTFYVLAESEEAADADAQELSDGVKDEFPERDISVREAPREPPAGEWVWSGGPEGSDEPW